GRRARVGRGATARVRGHPGGNHRERLPVAVFGAWYRRTAVTRLLGVAAVLCCACSATDPYATQVYKFGPFTLQPSDEITNQCVQITLHNTHDLFVNTIELTTGAGFHHSNWYAVPEAVFPGSDGSYTCGARGFDQAAAAARGEVVFAQST